MISVSLTTHTPEKHHKYLITDGLPVQTIKSVSINEVRVTAEMSSDDLLCEEREETERGTNEKRREMEQKWEIRH